MSMQYVRNYYAVPAKKGGRVQWNNRLGTITSATAYIHVRFDGTKHSVPLHPKEDGLVYLQPDAASGGGWVVDYKVGDRVRVWCGPGFVRTGVIRALRTDYLGPEAYVEFDYDIPSEWIPLRKMC